MQLRLGSVLVMVVIVGAAVARGAAARQAPDLPSEPRVSLEAFQKMHAQGRVTVIDVRAAESFAAGHIPKAISVPWDQVEARAAEIRAKAGRGTVVTYCSCPTEHLSLEAARTLRKLGFTDVVALTGGYTAWVAAGGKPEK
jgi:rhodanese-related sulfurtransferase